MAKAKRMSEARSRALSSSSDGNSKENDNAEVDPIQLRMGKLKSIQRNQLPKQEEPESELKRAMQAKANRVSRLWQENENIENIIMRKDTSENREVNAVNGKKISVVSSSSLSAEVQSVSSSGSSAGQNDDELTTTIHINDNIHNNNNNSHDASISSNSSKNSLSREQDVSAFVDSLFDPVLSSNFNDLSDERSVSNAIRGGGGTNEPSSQSGTQTSTTVAGTSMPSLAMSTPIGQNGPMFVPMSQTPGMYAANGYHGYSQRSFVGVNGYAGGTPNMVSPGMMGLSGYSNSSQDLASMAAQQQMLIEHLMTQQRLIQEQQKQLSQKSSDHMALLQQQHEQQIKALQQQLEAARAGVPNGVPSTTHTSNETSRVTSYSTHEETPRRAPSVTVHSSSSSTAITNGSIVNGHDNIPSNITKSTKTIVPPPPPPEFSDLNNDYDFIVPPPAFDAPQPPPPAQPPAVPYPPPPQVAPPPPPVAGKLATSSGVANAVAALEAKSPITKSKSEVVQYSVTTEQHATSPSTRPQLKTRKSSNVTVFVQEDKKTEKLVTKNNLFITPGQIPWKLSIRKEVRK